MLFADAPVAWSLLCIDADVRLFKNRLRRGQLKVLFQFHKFLQNTSALDNRLFWLLLRGTLRGFVTFDYLVSVILKPFWLTDNLLMTLTLLSFHHHPLGRTQSPPPGGHDPYLQTQRSSPLLFPSPTFLGQRSRSVSALRHRPSVSLTSECCNPVLDDPSHD